MFRTSHEAQLWWAPESGNSGMALAGDPLELPALPNDNAFALAGYYDVPNVVSDEGAKNGYGAGTPFAVYQIPGTRIYEINVTLRIAGSAVDFLRSCLLSSALGGFKGLPDLCLVVGANNNYSAGFRRNYRFAKCNSINLTMQEGSGQEITAQLQFWALAEDVSGADFTISTSQARAFGSALSWHNVMDFAIGNVSHRDVITSVNLSINHNLKRRGGRPDVGDDVAYSRTAYALTPGNVTETLSIGLADKLADTFVRAASNSTAWGVDSNTIVITCDNTLASKLDETDTKFYVRIPMARRGRGEQMAVEAGGDMLFSEEAVIAQTTITTS